tara:strand:- start:400 stop:906 length:507 start_codon:yes stop_codon:yes gene_type:complete
MTTTSNKTKVSNFIPKSPQSREINKFDKDGNCQSTSLTSLEANEQDEQGTKIERMFEKLVDITNQIESLTEESNRIKNNFLKELKLLEVDGQETIIHRDNGVEKIHMQTRKVFVYSPEMQKLEKANKDQREKLTNLKKNEVISGIATLKSQTKTVVFTPAPKPKKKNK